MASKVKLLKMSALLTPIQFNAVKKMIDNYGNNYPIKLTPLVHLETGEKRIRVELLKFSGEAIQQIEEMGGIAPSNPNVVFDSRGKIIPEEEVEVISNSSNPDEDN